MAEKIFAVGRSRVGSNPVELWWVPLSIGGISRIPRFYGREVGAPSPEGVILYFYR